MISYGYGVEFLPLQEEFNDLYRKYRNDFAVRRWCRQVGLIDSIQQDDWFIRVSQDPTIQMFHVQDKNAFVGVAGLTSIDMVNLRAEFSLWVKPGVHKKGYGEKALKTLFQYGFDELGLHIIWGETFEGNPAAGLFERLGMVPEGVRRDFYYKQGKFINAILYSIKDEEFHGNG